MNQKIIHKYLLDTDVLADHLINDSNSESYLIKLMSKGICFTSVFNAAELYLLAESEMELQCVNDVLYGIKVLGIHSRYSLSVHKYKDKINNLRDSLFFVLAEINKLKIVTFNPERYNSTSIIKAFHPEVLTSKSI